MILSLISQWLTTNDISLNANNTKIVILRNEWKQIIKYLNFRMGGQTIIT